VDLLGAQTLDVKGVARYKMLQMPHGLCTADNTTRAACDGIELSGLRILFAHGMTVADRASFRKGVWDGISRPLFHHDIKDLWNDVSSTLHDDRVTDADIMRLITNGFTGIADTLDIILVVQGCIGDNHAANRHGCQPCDRRQRTCA